MPDVPLASLAPPSPLQQQVAGFPAQAGGMMANVLGITDAMRALRGEMTPEEAQGFALSALPGLIPGAGEAGPLMRGAEKLAPEAAEAAIPLARGIRAFHGSPYDFDRFDLSKIGTGEGAQAYGHGLYFAEREGTARSYRDALSNDTMRYASEIAPVLPKQYQGTRDSGLRIIKDIQDAMDAGEIKKPEEFLSEYSVDPALRPAYEKAASLLANGGGKMYEVNIAADPEHFLDWDKPLSEQSEHVKNAIAKVDSSISPAAPNISQIKDPQIRSIVRSALKQNEGQADGLELMIDNDSNLYNAAVSHAKRSGIDLEQNDTRASDYVYQQAKDYIDALHASQNLMGDSLAKVLGVRGADMMQAGPAAARLREAGIPGIKYLDQGSRSEGRGTSNYVVFDDRLISILKKYGLAGLIAGGGGVGAMMQNKVPLSSLQQ